MTVLLLRDLYVDDFVISFNGEDLVYMFYQGTCNILTQGGFELRKWITNSENLLKHKIENPCEVNS